MIHQLARKFLFKARRAPGVLLWSASALVWAYSTRCLHAYNCGYRHGLSTADKFLERYPEIQTQFREVMSRDQ